MSQTIAEIVWIDGLLLTWIGNLVFHEKTTHLKLDWNYVRDQILDGIINTNPLCN